MSRIDAVALDMHISHALQFSAVNNSAVQLCRRDLHCRLSVRFILRVYPTCVRVPYDEPGIFQCAFFVLTRDKELRKRASRIFRFLYHLYIYI